MSLEIKSINISQFRNINDLTLKFSKCSATRYKRESEKPENENTIEFKEMTPFFGRYISNVTCILGENGSGKSSIIEGYLSLLDNPKQSNSQVIYSDNSTICKENTVENDQKSLATIYYAPLGNDKRIVQKNDRFLNLSEIEILSAFILNFSYVKQPASKDQLRLTSPLLYYNKNVETIILWYLFNFSKDKNKFPQDLIIKSAAIRLDSGQMTIISKAFTSNLAGNSFLKKIIDIIIYCATKNKKEFFPDRAQDFSSWLQNIKNEELLEVYEAAHYLCSLQECSEEEIKVENFFTSTEIMKCIKVLLDFRFNYHIEGSNIIEFDWSKSHQDLSLENVYSTGEKVLMLFTGRVLIEIRKLFRKGIKNFHVFLDEIEQGLHPKWQRCLLNDLISNIENLFETIVSPENHPSIHVILTSHSPFLPSDLPNECQIYIERKNGLTKVSDSMPDSFASNIHTILSNSFFLTDNVYLGEFSKSIIKEIVQEIEFLKGQNNKSKEFNKSSIISNLEKRISLIKEPLIRRPLESAVSKL